MFGAVKKLATLFGRQSPTTNPIGESRELVDRSEAQSVVSAGKFRDTTLHELWTKHRSEVFGDGYGYERFPLLIKILDASDWNRIGFDGKPRTLHVEQSLQCIDFADFEPSLGEILDERLVSHDCFTVDRWVLNEPRAANAEPKFSIFQVICGTVCFGTSHEFRFGDLFMVPALGHRSLVASKNGTAVVLRTTL